MVDNSSKFWNMEIYTIIIVFFNFVIMSWWFPESDYKLNKVNVTLTSEKQILDIVDMEAWKISLKLDVANFASGWINTSQSQFFVLFLLPSEWVAVFQLFCESVEKS